MIGKIISIYCNSRYNYNSGLAAEYVALNEVQAIKLFEEYCNKYKNKQGNFVDGIIDFYYEIGDYSLDKILANVNVKLVEKMLGVNFEQLLKDKMAEALIDNATEEQTTINLEDALNNVQYLNIEKADVDISDKN